MSVARFCYSNILLGSGVAITASSESVPEPASNIIHPWKTKMWSAEFGAGGGPPPSPEYVQFDLQSPKIVRQVAIAGHNLTPSFTVNILAATNSQFSPIAVTTPGLTINSNFDILLWEFPTNQNYQYWRIKVQAPSNSDPIKLGYASMGPFIEYDHRPGFELRVVDPSETVKSYDGQKAHFIKTKYRTVDILIGDATDFTGLNNLINDVGFSRDFFLLLDPKNDAFDNITDGLWRFSLYGSLIKWSHQHRYRGAINVPLTFEEAR